VSDRDRRLPVLAPVEDPDRPDACGAKVWVSLEESALVKALHDVRRRADEVRRRLETASPGERGGLESELEALRAERVELTLRREAAYRRKMVMLGHMADDEIELL
jgi:hypothetical protein